MPAPTPRALGALGLTLVLMLGAAACSDDDSGDEASSDTTAAPADGGSATTAAPESTTTTEAGPCPAETSIEIANSGTVDGEMDIVTEFADVTLDETADLVFASYEIEEDPQFGISAPVGDPGAPEGGLILQFSLSAEVDGVLATGEFPDDPDVLPRITFTSLYNGSERINPLGTHTITVTEITDEHICGQITGVGDTDLQTLPYVQGSFVVPVV